MKNIHVFILSTGIYNILWDDERIDSLNNLFPGYNKILTIMSDKDSTNNFKNCLSNEYNNINYYHVCNLVYPFVTLHKFNYITDACNIFKYDDNDYFIYLDAHSFILKKSESHWNTVISQLEKYDLCYPINPYLDFNSNSIYDDTRSKHYITDEWFCKNKSAFSQISTLMGNIGTVKKFNNEINKLLVDDMQYTGHPLGKQSIIPDFYEQHYANYIFYNYFINNYNYGFTCHNDWYINQHIDIHTENDNSMVFIRCHYYGDYANIVLNSKRNSKKYIENF